MIPNNQQPEITDEMVKDFFSNHLYEGLAKSLYEAWQQFKSTQTSHVDGGRGWEIQCLVVGDRNYWVDKDGLYSSDLFEPTCSLENIMSLHNFKHIHSVKRLSDGEVFVLGDKISHKGTPQIQTIATFRITEANQIYVSGYNYGWGLNLSEISKAPIPEEPKPVLPIVPVYLTQPQIDKLIAMLGGKD